MFHSCGKIAFAAVCLTVFSAKAAVSPRYNTTEDNTSEVWSEVQRNVSDLNALMEHCSNPVEENGVYTVALDLYAADVRSTDVQVKVIKGDRQSTLVILVLQNKNGTVNVMSGTIPLSKPVMEQEVSTKVEEGILLITVPIKRSAQLSGLEEEIKVLPELRAAQNKMQEMLNQGVIWDAHGFMRGTRADATIMQIDVNGVSYTRSNTPYDYNIVINTPEKLIVYDSVSDQKVETEKEDDKMFKTYLIGTDKELSQYYRAGSREIDGERCVVFKSDIEGGELCISEEWGIPIYRKNSFWRYEQTISNIGVGGIKMKWFEIPSQSRSSHR